jgi:hypothetical protein
MTIVGYNDAIWTDVNSNGLIDTGEKGAFRIANSWGTGWYEGGFTWLAYDALRSPSAVPDGPSTGRIGAFQSDMVFVLTARNGYTPFVVGEFTLNHAKRNQLRLSLGRSATTATVPTTTWSPSMMWNQGGAFAFDGSTTAVNGTFVLDFTDILAAGAGPQRYYLGVNDNVTGDPATLSAFKIVDLTTDPDTETASSLVPQTADGQQIYAYADYTYAGPAYNDPPQLSSPQVNPVSGTDGSIYTFTVRYTDQDGDVPTVKNVVLDGAVHAMTLVSGQPPANGWYSFETMLAAGSHGHYFYFEDGHGESARTPLAGDASGPMVYGVLANTLSPSSAAAGGADFVLAVSGSYFENGAVVTWDGIDRPTTFISTTSLTAQIGAADIATGKNVPVRVRNPGGLTSNILSFTVNNPVPSLTSISPTSATGGGSAPSLTLRGSSFVSSSVARLNGMSVATTYVSPTELQASLTAQNVSAAGEFAVTVLNPAPAGGASMGVSFTVSDFSLSASPATLGAVAGQSASGSIQVTPQFASFDAPVSFRCSGLPRGCTASFTPSTVTPGAAGGTTTMTLSTTARGGSMGLLAATTDGLVPPALGLILLLSALAAPALFRWTARRRLATVALVLMMVWLAGCGAGGGSQDQGTPAGTYEFLVNGTSGSMSALTSVTLIVD